MVAATGGLIGVAGHGLRGEEAVAGLLAAPAGLGADYEHVPEEVHESMEARLAKLELQTEWLSELAQVRSALGNPWVSIATEALLSDP